MPRQVIFIDLSMAAEFDFMMKEVAKVGGTHR